ncbi:TetR/AcrR family transcriptional regulator [Nocardiopsis prasina]|uniref:TetR/AcrR family transcriptional regulator n=1 Tax=Nocardiopsis prasina TaxID=2015 RepID=UPI001360B040|nr:TetR/AcrR family transcriptional regulator [Nocardiopsis prasina]
MRKASDGRATEDDQVERRCEHGVRDVGALARRVADGCLRLGRRPSECPAAEHLSSASLYGAFGSKKALFERALAHHVAGPGRVSEIVGDPTLGPITALTCMLFDTIYIQSDPSHPRGCLVANSATVGATGDDDVDARRIVAARRADDRARIEDCLRRGITVEALRADLDAGSAALVVHSFVLGISTQVLDGVGAESLHASARTIVDGTRAH